MTPIDPTSGDDAFDAMLTRALRSLPEPMAPTNLAARAMDLARAEQRDVARLEAFLRRRRWFHAVSTALAASIVLAVVLLGGVRIHRAGNIAALWTSYTTTTDSTDSTTDTDVTTTVSTSTSSSTTTPATGLGILAIVIAGIVVWRSLDAGGSVNPIMRFPRVN